MGQDSHSISAALLKTVLSSKESLLTLVAWGPAGYRAPGPITHNWSLVSNIFKIPGILAKRDNYYEILVTERSPRFETVLIWPEQGH